MPFTSESNGNGVNKIKLGTISTLPSSLRGNDTYAVFNQIRTVNADRFIALKEGDMVVQCKIDEEIFLQLLRLGVDDILHNLDQENKLNLLKSLYEEQCVIKAKDLAYSIIRLEKEYREMVDEETESQKIPSKERYKKAEGIKKEIKAILTNIPYNQYSTHISKDIQCIFDKIVK